MQTDNILLHGQQIHSLDEPLRKAQ